MRSVPRMRKPPASPARRLSMVSASTRQSSTVSLDQTRSPEATRPTQRPEAQWKVKVTAHTATIVAPYLNVASDLAVMSNGGSPCVLPIVGMGRVQNILEVILQAVSARNNIVHFLEIASSSRSNNFFCSRTSD